MALRQVLDWKFAEEDKRLRCVRFFAGDLSAH